MSEQMYTFRDAIEHARDYLGGAVAAAVERDVRNAVIEAYRQLSFRRRWNYYYRAGRVQLQSPYKTGTVTYQSSSHTLVLADGVWPLWSESGVVFIGGDEVRHQVVARESDTVLRLDSMLNPGSDITTGSSYELVKDTFRLPFDFHEMAEPRLKGVTGWVAAPTTIEEIQKLRRTQPYRGQPRYYSVAQDPSWVGHKALHLWPIPETSESLDFSYYRSPRGLRYSGFSASDSQGVVSVTAGMSVVVGTGTSFTSDMVGSVIRISGNSNIPDGPGGQNRYVIQDEILAVSSSTSITLRSNVPVTLSGVKYVISDPIDISPYMWSAFLRGVELELVRRRRMSGLDAAVLMYERECSGAEAADSPVYEPQSMWQVGGFQKRRLTADDYIES